MDKQQKLKAVPNKMTNKVPGLVAGLALGVPFAIYSLFLGLSSIPFFQRHFLYAHKFTTIWWPGTNLNEPERWGFAKNQATPFHLNTPDGNTLHAWHILPLSVYNEHEASLLSVQRTGLVHDITSTLNFQLLRDDPSAKLIISFHGNAGHLLQSLRPRLYHTLSQSRYHVLALSYRGFGHSTGSPSEPGLILDAATAINFAVKTAGIPPSRIVLLGHSLGTAVASGASELFTAREGVDFAGVVLVAPFSSLPTMLSGYSIAGFIPVLRPLAWWPWLLRKVMDRVVDKWESAARWTRIVRAVRAPSQGGGRGRRLRLSLVHAKNDWDIPCHEDDKLFKAAVQGLFDADINEGWFRHQKDSRTEVKGKDSFVSTWTEGDVEIRQELVPWGGHNDVAFSAPVLLAILRCFGDVETAS